MTRSVVADLGTLYRFLPRERRRQLILLLFLMTVTALAEMAMVVAIVPFVSLLTVGSAGTEQPATLARLLELVERVYPTNALAGASLLFAITVLVTCALRLSLASISQRFAFALGHELSVEIDRRLLYQPYLFHVQRHSGELLAALGKVDHLVFSLVLQSIQAASAAIIGLFVAIVLISIDPISTMAAAVLIGGFYWFMLRIARRRLAAHAEVIAQAYEQRLQSMQESLSAIRDVIIDRSQNAQIERFRMIDRRLMHARTRAAFLAAAPRFLVEAMGLILIALLAVAITARSGGIAAALPILGAMALGALRLLPLVSQLYSGWVSLASSGPILAEITTLVSLPMPPNHGEAIAPRFAEAIRLDSVGFHYPGRRLPALKDVSLTIPRGSRVAFTGKTGSGKSTLSDLLMGLIQPDQGRVLVDGVELSGPLLEGWRQSIAHVPQTTTLAAASITENIALSLPNTAPAMERVREAAERAQLTSFIESLPDGFDTMIGERGVRLSGGQRQRLALARAIYKKTPLLVLDEATSALDDETEAAVLAALDEFHAERCTIVIIAHRMSTVARCDRIFVLDEGSLIKSGTFADLYGPLNRLRQQGEL